jgi:TolB-like protein/DNA-binding SARP family transcriptional activator/Tfp pilus assembly protein PilF
MKSPSCFYVRLLGGFELTRDDGIEGPIRLSTKKVCALVAFVAMSRKQSATREELATLLWGSCSEQQARQSLRQALVLLRKDLGSPNVLYADKETIRFEPGVWSVDAREFERLADSAKLEDLERAVALYSGEFLAGISIEEEGFDEWLRARRNRIRMAAGRALATYAERADAAGNGLQALTAVERLLALDPLREDWQRLALTLYARYRGKNEALAQAGVFAATLQRELGVAPEKETRALVEKIRASESALERSPIEIVAAQMTSVPPETLPPIARPPTEYFPEASENVARPRGWTPFWSTRNVAAILVLGGVIALGAAGLSYKHLLPAQPGERTAMSAGTPDLPRRAQTQAASSDDPRQPAAAAEQAPEKATLTQPSGVAAVLIMPFTVVGDGNERSTLFADLISDDLTNQLGRIGGFRVIARQTAMSYRGQQVDPAAVGKELGVRYLVDGSVEAQGENLRVSVELVDAGSGQRMWSARFDRSGTDLAVIQDEIVRGIGRELQIEVTRIESGRDSQDLDVHTLIYKGWTALSAAGRAGPPALEQAEKYFAQVLAREPNNTRAMTGLGAYHIQMAAQLFTADPVPHLAKAEALLLQVIERRPDVGGPSRFLGSVNMARGRADLAIPWFEREIERNPSHPSAYAQLGRALVRTDKPEEGLKHILYAMRLSPRDPEMSAWLDFAGGAELELTHDDKAIEYLNRSLALYPNHPPTLLALAAAYALTGRLDAARSRLEQVQRSLPYLPDEKMIERLFGTPKRSGGGRLTEGLRLVLAPAADPWASPRPPLRASGENVAAPGGTIIPILVLPFKTFGESGVSTERLAEMVADDLTNLLSRVQSMRVISRQTALTFKGQAIDVAAVGAELQVRYVLDGSMRMQGDKLRVNIELIDPKTRLPVWSTRIEREDADRSGVLDEIVGRLAREFQLELVGIEAERHSKDQDVDALITRGWAALQTITPASYRHAEAEAYFREALERDPQSAAAQTGLGAFHARIGLLLLDNGEPSEHLDRARDLLQDAVRRNPQSGIAHFYLGLALKRPPTYQQAIEQFERAIELNPSLAAAHAHIGDILAQTGRPSEGIEHVKYALRLSPRDPSLGAFLNMAGLAEIELGDFHAAIKYLQRAIALLPSYERAWAGLAAAHALGGNIDEAHGDAKRLRDFVPDLNTEALIDRFGRTKNSRLREGLNLAFAPPLAAATVPAPGIR